MPIKCRESWLLRLQKRIGLLVVGRATKKLSEDLVDWFIYGLVVTYSTLHWGVIIGSIVSFVIMAPFTAGLCLIYLRLYDRSKKDWLGLETIKLMRDGQNHGTRMGRFAYHLAKKGDFLAFIVLSIYGDAFLTTVYMRKGAHVYEGLSQRDWRIFWGSHIVTNVYWTLRWTVIVAIFAKIIEVYPHFQNVLGSP